MLFLVTGASGVGKSTVRALVAPQLGNTFEAVELKDLGPVDEVTLAWRQEMAEVAAARAATLTAYAQWMREHAVDPLPGMHVLTSDGAPGMQRERLIAAADVPQRWHMHVVDTSEAPPAEVATRVREWIDSALADEALVMHPEHWQEQGCSRPCHAVRGTLLRSRWDRRPSSACTDIDPLTRPDHSRPPGRMATRGRSRRGWSGRSRRADQPFSPQPPSSSAVSPVSLARSSSPMAKM